MAFIKANISAERRCQIMHMIVTMDRNGAIGKAGKLPDWCLKDDNCHFLEKTRRKITVMGTKTFFLRPKKFRPFENREENIILSRNLQLFIAGCTVLNRVEHILRDRNWEDIWVIGGGEIYKLFFPLVNHIVVTHVDTVIEEADVFFPGIPENWRSQEVYSQEKNERNQFPFHIVEYRK